MASLNRTNTRFNNHFKVMPRVKLTCVALTIIFAPCFWSRVVVDSTVGRIVGTRRDSFTSFLGVPYGRVDKNDPFGKPLPHPNLTTEFQATENPPLCPQLVKGEPKGSLDCLRLNIYIPNNNTKPLPVIIHLHGGSFVDGNGNLNTYSPKFLVAKDIIVVTVNYRLGIYGFLCFEDTDFNHKGLEDQQLAMKWIKDNIKDFGGDSNNLVFSGHSSGSMSVGYHLLFENRYFNKVILQSGMILSPISEPNGFLTNKILERLGLDIVNKSVPERIAFLKQFGVHELVKLTSNETHTVCIGDTYLKHSKLEELKNVKILAGSTNKEAAYFFANPNMGPWFKDLDVGTVLRYVLKDVDSNMIDDINAFYIKGKGKDGLIDFASDFLYGYPVQQSAKLYLKYKATVYRYIFLYDGGRNYMKLRDGIVYGGAVHGDELGYLFDMDMFGKDIAHEDAVMIDVLTTLWSSFAHKGSIQYEEVEFPETNMDNKPQLILNGTRTHSETNVFKERMAFWDKFYEKYGTLSKSFPCLNTLLEYEANPLQSSCSFRSTSFTTILLCLVLFFTV